MADEAQVVTSTPAVVEAAPVVAPIQATAPAVSPSPTESQITTQSPPTGTGTEASPGSSESPQSTTVLGDALEKSATAEKVTPVETKSPETDATKSLTDSTAQTETVAKDAAEAAKKDEGGQTEQAPPPKYDPWTLPEGVTLDEARVGEFTNLLAELETSGKATHEAVQQFGQRAVEFHVNEVKNAVERITDIYQKAWDKQKTDWKEAFLKDPDIGGNRFQTTLDSALTFIRTHGGNEDQQKEFRQLMDSSGLGNHPAVIRLLANAGRAMSEGRPLAAPKPISQPKSKTQVMYGKG